MFAVSLMEFAGIFLRLGSIAGVFVGRRGVFWASFNQTPDTMKACFTFLILLLALGRGFGQQIPVAGRVLDAKQRAVPFATVALVAADDSVVVEA